jgi:tRNA1Val (adenine37-N6)-methyltransferase
MANNYFKFKEFTVYQEACAMKVTTDACLFGSWAAQILHQINPATILDIGTGTGLLSLMIAQQTNSKIDAVEIDELAAEQAKTNFQQSTFSERLKVHCSSIQDFKSEQRFDCIVSNPPFFSNDLQSADDKRNLALHSTKLDLDNLLTCIDKLLSSEGQFAILLPFHRTEDFIQLANQFFLIKKVLVKQTNQHAYFRSMLFFSRKETGTTYTSEIVIKESEQSYSTAFQQLLSPYYLYL